MCQIHIVFTYIYGRARPGAPPINAVISEFSNYLQDVVCVSNTDQLLKSMCDNIMFGSQPDDDTLKNYANDIITNCDNSNFDVTNSTYSKLCSLARDAVDKIEKKQEKAMTTIIVVAVFGGVLALGIIAGIIYCIYSSYIKNDDSHDYTIGYNTYDNNLYGGNYNYNPPNTPANRSNFY